MKKDNICENQHTHTQDESILQCQVRNELFEGKRPSCKSICDWELPLYGKLEPETQETGALLGNQDMAPRYHL